MLNVGKGEAQLLGLEGEMAAPASLKPTMSASADFGGAGEKRAGGGANLASALQPATPSSRFARCHFAHQERGVLSRRCCKPRRARLSAVNVAPIRTIQS